MSTGRITTPFGPQSTASEVIAGVRLIGARAVVTGGSSGIGLETSRALASAGAEVTLAVRDVEAGGGSCSSQRTILVTSTSPRVCSEWSSIVRSA